MILFCGIPSEPPVERVRTELVDLGVPHVMFNQREANQASVEFGVEGDSISGALTVTDGTFELASISGVYTRMMDSSRLPELADEPPTSPKRSKVAEVHDALTRWMEIAPGRVINRVSAMSSNHSKPYQSQIISAFGFATPETLITNDPEAARAFRERVGRVVYKSISGARSIVSEVTQDDVRRLDDIRWCPVQFQEYVPGLDVRVHVVGTKVFATAVNADGIDYRYVGRLDGGELDLNPVDIDGTVAGACIALTEHLGLELSGIDLRQTPDGRIYCFEVNPSPAFTFYESGTGQPIARAIARHLAGDDD